MEDTEQILHEHGIIDGKWVEMNELLDKETEIEPEGSKHNPSSKICDPYAYVAHLLKDLDKEDLNNGQMLLSKSLNDSISEREVLIGKHFSTYITCGILAEKALSIEDRLSKIKVAEQKTSLNYLLRMVGPVVEEEKIKDEKQKQLEFINNNRMLFDGPEALETHLNAGDYTSFITDYLQAKLLSEKYQRSKFVSYLWSRFIKVLAKFKIEISARISKCKSIPECIHYFNLYIQVDPHSSNKVFGTFLTIAKKEFNEKLSILRERDRSIDVPPLELLTGFVKDLLESFEFMVKSMKAIDLVYSQEKQMNEFVVNGIENYKQIICTAIAEIFPPEIPSNHLSTPKDTKQAIDAVKSIIGIIMHADRKIETESMPLFSSHPAMSAIYKSLLSFLWSSAEKYPPEILINLAHKSYGIQYLKTYLPDQIAITVKEILYNLMKDNVSLEHSSSVLKSIYTKLLPSVTQYISLEIKTSIDFKLNSVHSHLGQRLKAELTALLNKTQSEEQFLMIVLRMKNHYELQNPQLALTAHKSISETLANYKLSPLSRYYLQKYISSTDKIIESTEKDTFKKAMFSRQFSVLLL
ncbi:hypothetical protein NEOKW01_1453 [Nematocida sp. AWRm80]|nr:hypothetical protein NEOKW01_1453 [Nematocida sp. AWRm80]